MYNFYAIITMDYFARSEIEKCAPRRENRGKHVFS